MGIFHVFLDQFQVNEQDLEETVNSPAYHLLTQLLNDTPLLIKVTLKYHYHYCLKLSANNEDHSFIDLTCIFLMNRKPHYPNKYSNILLYPSQIMTVVESASKVLSKGERLKGGHLSAAKSAVKLLALTLEMQEEMLSLLRESSATTIVTPLQQLLLTINPSTRNSDFILHIAKLVLKIQSL